MAGLLDFLNSDEAKLGMGLLAAAGPQTDPSKTGFGYALQSAMESVDARKRALLQNQLLLAQAEEHTATAANKKGLTAAMADLFSSPAAGATTAPPDPNAGTAAGAPVIGTGLLGAPSTGEAPASPGAATAAPAAGVAPGSLKGVPLAKVERLKAFGGPDLTHQWELENIGVAMQPGWVKFADGSMKYIGDPAKGLTVENGQVVPMPGAGAAQAAVAAPTAEQSEMLKRYYNIPPTTLNARGQPSYNPLPMPTPLYIGGAPATGQASSTGGATGGGGTTLPGGPLGSVRPPISVGGGGRPEPGLPPPEPGIPAASFMLDRTGRVDVDRAMRAINFMSNPQEKANALRGLELQVKANEAAAGIPSTAGGAGGTSIAVGKDGQPLVTQPGVSDLSAQQKADIAVEESRGKEQAKADVLQQGVNRKIIDNGQAALKAVTDVLNHPGMKGATGFGSINPLNLIPGTDAYNFNTRLAQVKGGVFLHAYETLKGAGPITDIEGEKAEAAIARMDKAQSTAEFVNAMKDYRAAVAAGIKKAGGTIPEGMDVSPGEAPQPKGSKYNRQPSPDAGKPQVVESLPPASSVKPGTTATDNATGKKKRSDGMIWRDV